MKPYPGTSLAEEKQVFNYRLSRVVENAFGILAVRWQVLYCMLNCDVDGAKLVVQACVVLHNYLQMSPNSSTYVNGDKVESNGNLVKGS